MTVVSPKTEGCGQGQRIVPLFERLRPYLEAAWDMAEEGQTHVIPETRYLPAAHGPRGWNSCNLRTTFEKIIHRAGLEQWPRVFHALRASCESDLAREYPITTVCKWIGNTVAIAQRHYVQVTDADFQRASGAAPNRAHTAPVEGSIASSKNGKPPFFPRKTRAYLRVHPFKWRRRESNKVPFPREKADFLNQAGQKPAHTLPSPR